MNPQRRERATADLRTFIVFKGNGIVIARRRTKCYFLKEGNIGAEKEAATRKPLYGAKPLS